MFHHHRIGAEQILLVHQRNPDVGRSDCRLQIDDHEIWQRQDPHRLRQWLREMQAVVERGVPGKAKGDGRSTIATGSFGFDLRSEPFDHQIGRLDSGRGRAEPLRLGGPGDVDGLGQCGTTSGNQKCAQKTASCHEATVDHHATLPSAWILC